LYDYRQGAMSSHDLNCAFLEKAYPFGEAPGGMDGN
jgi:hypothetical protein